MNATVGSGGGLCGVVRRHPVASFLVWSFPVGQAIAFQPVLGREVYGVDLPTAPFVVGANLLGLLLPALVITGIVEGRAGVQGLWQRAARVRLPLRWYGLALLVVPSATTAIAVALLGAPGPTGGVLVSALVSGLLVQVLLGFLTTNWAEEVAWTGFLQSRLQDRHGPVRAALATGPLFALQHAALAYGNGWLGGTAVLLFITATAVPFRFLQGWVANRTGSLFVVGLVHAAGNATTDGSGFAGPGMLPRLFPEDTVGPVHLLASAALGLVVLAATRARLGAMPDRAQPPAAPAPETPGRPRDAQRASRPVLVTGRGLGARRSSAARRGACRGPTRWRYQRADGARPHRMAYPGGDMAQLTEEQKAQPAAARRRTARPS